MGVPLIQVSNYFYNGSRDILCFCSERVGGDVDFCRGV